MPPAFTCRRCMGSAWTLLSKSVHGNACYMCGERKHLATVGGPSKMGAADMLSRAMSLEPNRVRHHFGRVGGGQLAIRGGLKIEAHCFVFYERQDSAVLGYS